MVNAWETGPCSHMLAGMEAVDCAGKQVWGSGEGGSLREYIEVRNCGQPCSGVRWHGCMTSTALSKPMRTFWLRARPGRMSLVTSLMPHPIVWTLKHLSDVSVREGEI